MIPTVGFWYSFIDYQLVFDYVVSYRSREPALRNVSDGPLVYLLVFLGYSLIHVSFLLVHNYDNVLMEKVVVTCFENWPIQSEKITT